jgi:hypothetical protein
VDKFFVKQTYVFDESLFRTGYPYKLQYEDIDEPSYELFIKIDRVTGNAVFRRYDGAQHAVHVQDYLDDKLTITGPLTITFDDCAISIDDIKPETFINGDFKTYLDKNADFVKNVKDAMNVAKQTQQTLDEINGYPHSFITVNTDSTSPYTISDGHAPLTTELEDIMRNDDTDKEDHTNEG